MKRLPRNLLFLVPLALLATLAMPGVSKCLAQAGGPESPFYVGAAERDVTPPVGSMITHPPRKSVGVHDPLFVRAFYLVDNHGNSVVILGTDFIGAGFEVCDAIRARVKNKFGITETIINCSHAHSSVGLGKWNPDMPVRDQFGEWNKKTHQAIMDCIAEAKEKAVPVRLKSGRSKAQVGFNRRLVSNEGHVFMGVNEKGPVVPWVNVLVAESIETGKPVSVLFEHAAHPVIVPNGTGLISADFPGAAVARIREELGDDVIAVFGQGCGGNINGYPLRTSHANATKAGHKLGDAAVKAVRESELIDADRLVIKSASAALPSYPLPSAETLAKIKQRSKGRDWQMNHLNKVQAMLDEGRTPPARRFDTYSVQLGSDWCLMTLPHEVFCEYELWVDETAPFKRTMTFGYTNGGQGYVGIDAAIRLGANGGYEAGSLPNWGGSSVLSEFFGPPAVGCEGIIKEAMSSLWAEE